jgi:hypothetical protein
MDTVIMAKDFDIKHIKLGSLRTLDNGGKVVYVNYKDRPLILQTPKLKAPFGLSNWEGKYSLDLSLAGYDGSVENTTTFFNVLSQLDEFMLEQGLANGMSWFKRKMASKDVVDALYTRNVKFPKDRTTGEITDKYPPTFKLSLPTRDGKFQCDAYDVKREKVDLSAIELKGGKITALAQCLGLWVAGGKFGCSWKVIQLRVEPQEALTGYAFRDLDDGHNEESDIDDIDPVPAAPVKAEVKAEVKTEVKTEVKAEPKATPTSKIETSDEEDGDEDDEDEDEDEDDDEDGDDGEDDEEEEDELEKVAAPAPPAPAAAAAKKAPAPRGRKAAA